MNINNFASKCHLLYKDIGDIKSWVWPIDDHQTFDLIVYDYFATIRPLLEKQFGNAKDGVVIQAGGNCGVYPLLYTEFFSSVYTFEPDPLNFYCLVNNCQFPQIIKFNAALSDKSALLSIENVVPSNRGMIKVNNIGSNKCIQSMTIDSLELENVKFIQLDIEGFEVNALNGAEKTINKYKPLILLESGDANNPVNFQQIKNTDEKMKSFNYKSMGHINRLDVLYTPN